MRSAIQITLVAILLFASTYLGSVLGIWPWTNHFLIVGGFLVFLTIVSDQINLKALDQEGRAVIIPYLVSTILKLVFSGIFLILFVKQNIDFAQLIVYAFLTYYAVFSVLEIILVNKRTRAKKF